MCEHGWCGAKGVVDVDRTERVYRGIYETGVRPPCIFACDKEPSPKALREELAWCPGKGATPQELPVGESQSNRAVEDAARLLKGAARVHAIAPEPKLGATGPIGHAIPP